MVNVNSRKCALNFSCRRCILLLLILLCHSGITKAQELIARPDAIWVTQRTDASITVAWSPVNDSRLQSYNLRLNGKYAGWTQPGVTSFTFENLQSDEMYMLGVLSVEVPAKIYSNDISITASVDLPSPEKIWITDQSTTSISVAWTPVTDDRLHSYNLRLNGSYVGWTRPGTTAYTFENLQPGSNYSLGVLSVEIPASVYSDAITVSATTDSNLIKAPTEIKVSSSTQTSVTVVWTPVSDPRVQSYNLALNGVYAGWTSPDLTEFTFEGLSPDTQYSLGVRSVELPGEIYSPLTTVSTTTPDNHNSCGNPEQYQTATVNDVEHSFVDVLGNPNILNGINVRSPITASNAQRYTQSQLSTIALKGFDHIRVPLDWYSFEVANGVYDADKLAALDLHIDTAAAVGLDVILDPIHLKSDESANFWGVPAWAWGDVNPDRTKVFDELTEHALPYLKMMTERYCDNSTVIAIDLVNEPREPNRGSLDARNRELVAMYGTWLDELRLIDPNKPFLLEPFYGGASISGDILNSLSQYENVIWSMHDYYAGEGSPQDGYSNGGYASVSPRTESWNSSGIYPKNNRTSAREGMSSHISVHRNAAASAGIPTHVGEYGIPIGWNGRTQFHCDKTLTYNSLAVPRTAWVWNQDIDGGFGMWHPNSGWVHWVDGIFDPACQ